MVQVIKKILHLQERRLNSDLKIKSFVSYSLFLCLLHIVSFYFSVLSCQPFSCVRHPGVERAETRMSNMPRPGCQTCQDPGVIQCPSVSPCFLSAFRCFLSARMRIYYNVSLLPDFPSSLKNMFFNTFVNQRFIKMFKRNSKKFPYIFGVYVIKSYFCTRFREREQRCFDILTGTAQELLPISSAWGLFLSGTLPLKKQNEKKTSENIWKI